MSKQRIEIEVDVPSGFEAVAYRKPSAGEWYEYGGVAHQSCIEFARDSHLILRRVEPKRESRWVSAHLLDTVQVGVWSGSPTEHLSGHPFVRVDFEDGKAVSVALESVEGKG